MITCLHAFSAQLIPQTEVNLMTDMILSHLLCSFELVLAMMDVYAKDAIRGALLEFRCPLSKDNVSRDAIVPIFHGH